MSHSTLSPPGTQEPLLIVQTLKKKHRMGYSPFVPSVNNLGAHRYSMKLISTVSPASWWLNGGWKAGSPIPKTLYKAVGKARMPLLCPMANILLLPLQAPLKPSSCSQQTPGRQSITPTSKASVECPMGAFRLLCHGLCLREKWGGLGTSPSKTQV